MQRHELYISYERKIRISSNCQIFLTFDAAKIKSAGFPGSMKPSKTTLQVIVGPDVEFVADALKAEVAKRRMK